MEENYIFRQAGEKDLDAVFALIKSRMARTGFIPAFCARKSFHKAQIFYSIFLQIILKNLPPSQSVGDFVTLTQWYFCAIITQCMLSESAARKNAKITGKTEAKNLFIG